MKAKKFILKNQETKDAPLKLGKANTLPAMPKDKLRRMKKS